MAFVGTMAPAARLRLIGSPSNDIYRSDHSVSQAELTIMSESDQITGRQIAAGRALARLEQSDVAKAASISIPTLRRMESSEGPATGMVNNVMAVRRALEAAGIEFIPENGGGAGVRLRKAKPFAHFETIPVEDLNAENDE